MFTFRGGVVKDLCSEIEDLYLNLIDDNKSAQATTDNLVKFTVEIAPAKNGASYKYTGRHPTLQAQVGPRGSVAALRRTCVSSTEIRITVVSPTYCPAPVHIPIRAPKVESHQLVLWIKRMTRAYYTNHRSNSTYLYALRDPLGCVVVGET